MQTNPRVCCNEFNRLSSVRQLICLAWERVSNSGPYKSNSYRVPASTWNVMPWAAHKFGSKRPSSLFRNSIVTISRFSGEKLGELCTWCGIGLFVSYNIENLFVINFTFPRNKKIWMIILRYKCYAGCNWNHYSTALIRGQKCCQDLCPHERINIYIILIVDTEVKIFFS